MCFTAASQQSERNDAQQRSLALSGDHMNSSHFEEKQLVRLRQRAESAEQLAAEESAKVTALEQLVEQLLAESASLQRKWEARRDAPTPASPSFAPSPLPQAPQPPPPADRDACVGVIMVRLLALEPIAGAAAVELLDAEAALFVVLRLGEGVVRSHALRCSPGGGDACLREWNQAFALPVLAEGTAGARTSPAQPVPLRAIVCESDGDGGGTPLAACTLHADALSLTPFVSSVVSGELSGSEAPQMAYVGAVPWAADRMMATPERPSLGAANGHRQLCVRLCVRLEWRPFAASESALATQRVGAGAAVGAAAMPPLDALGFELPGAAGGTPSTPHRTHRQRQREMETPLRQRGAAAEREQSEQARHAAGGWWETDAMQLRVWNASICSCASLDEVHPRRLRRLLVGGVPFQHRAHVWLHSCRGAPLALRMGGHGDLRMGGHGDLRMGGHGDLWMGGHGDLRMGGHGEGGEGDGARSKLAAVADTVAATDDAASALASAHRVIAVDLLRTFPSHPWFSHGAAGLIAPLRRVLHALAAHNPCVGYCQGLNFVAGLLLLHADTSDAFALLATFCARLLPRYHSPRMEGLHVAQAALLDVIAATTPRALERLQREGVPIKEQSTSWLLCAFLDSLPLESTLRVWDMLFVDGQVALLRAAAAAFALHEEALLAADPSELFDLGLVLECDAARLMAASLEPKLLSVAAAALEARLEEAWKAEVAE